MNKKTLEIINAVLGILGIVLVAVGAVFFSSQQQQTIYWKWVLIIGICFFFLAALIAILLRWKWLAIHIFLNTNFETPSDNLKRLLVKKEADLFKQFAAISRHVLKLRQVRFIDDFGEYCDACTEMLNKSTAKDKILTIQTPISLIDEAISEDERRKYDEYIHATIAKIIHTDTEYRRLVVLYEHDVEPEIKIKDFVQKLVNTAVATENATSPRFNFSNTFIGFVFFSSVPELIYSNLDIHITTENDFSIAFAGKAAIRKLHFGGSLRLQDDERRVSKNLIENFEAVWGKCDEKNDTIALQQFYSAFDPAHPKNDAEKTAILQALSSEVDRIVTKLKPGGKPVAHHAVEHHEKAPSHKGETPLSPGTLLSST
jgi:hypothetical protein